MERRRQPRLRGLRLLIPKYARLEIERRWLVHPARLPDLSTASHRRIDDLYLEGGLRLRRITDGATGEREYKLGKKYARPEPMVGAIATLYLTEAEYAALAGLPGARLSKRRYKLDGFSIDVFEGPLEGLVLTEIEAESREAALALQPPAWAAREVTEDPFFTGGALSRTTAAELKARLGL